LANLSGGNPRPLTSNGRCLPFQDRFFSEGLMNRSLSFLVFLVIAGLVAGCGGDGRKVKVTGQLFKNGKPLTIKTDVMRPMALYPYESAKEGKGYSPVVNDDGTFEVADVPTGKYIITLELLGDHGDMCKGLFASKEKSKLIRDVIGDEPLKIEITKADGK
jgi:hypothetical protein